MVPVALLLFFLLQKVKVKFLLVLLWSYKNAGDNKTSWTLPLDGTVHLSILFIAGISIIGSLKTDFKPLSYPPPSFGVKFVPNWLILKSSWQKYICSGLKTIKQLPSELLCKLWASLSNPFSNQWKSHLLNHPNEQNYCHHDPGHHHKSYKSHNLKERVFCDLGLPSLLL